MILRHLRRLGPALLLWFTASILPAAAQQARHEALARLEAWIADVEVFEAPLRQPTWWERLQRRTVPDDPSERFKAERELIERFWPIARSFRDPDAASALWNELRSANPSRIRTFLDSGLWAENQETTNFRLTALHYILARAQHPAMTESFIPGYRAASPSYLRSDDLINRAYARRMEILTKIPGPGITEGFLGFFRNARWNAISPAVFDRMLLGFLTRTEASPHAEELIGWALANPNEHLTVADAIDLLEVHRRIPQIRHLSEKWALRLTTRALLTLARSERIEPAERSRIFRSLSRIETDVARLVLDPAEFVATLKEAERNWCGSSDTEMLLATARKIRRELTLPQLLDVVEFGLRELSRDPALQATVRPILAELTSSPLAVTDQREVLAVLERLKNLPGNYYDAQRARDAIGNRIAPERFPELRPAVGSTFVEPSAGPRMDDPKAPRSDKAPGRPASRPKDARRKK
jgi:hypothetical protein